MKRTLLMIILVFAAYVLVSFAGSPDSIADMIAKHRASVGLVDVTNSGKPTKAEGGIVFVNKTGGLRPPAPYGLPTKLMGKMRLISETSKIQFTLDYGSSKYNQTFSFDGQEAVLARGSILGEIFHEQPQILRDGLLGGVLNASWVLFRHRNNGQLKYNGIKEIEGQQLHEIIYKTSSSGRGDIRLYLDTKTSHHVLTVYTVERSNPAAVVLSGTAVGSDVVDAVGNAPTASAPNSMSVARREPVHYRMEERFKDFQQVNGMMLPRTWNIRVVADGYAEGKMEWNIKLINSEASPETNSTVSPIS